MKIVFLGIMPPIPSRVDVPIGTNMPSNAKLYVGPCIQTFPMLSNVFVHPPPSWLVAFMGYLVHLHSIHIHVTHNYKFCQKALKHVGV